MLKKSCLLTAYNGLQCCNICALSTHSTTSTTSSYFSTCPRIRRRSQLNLWSGRRSFASTRDERGPDFRDNMNWPCRKVTPSTPTPYEIFELERDAAYTKQTKLMYYELVKLYHPDRVGHQDSGRITHLERLERYRLVVQAHEILSDPIKRRAYDAYGAGWGERSITKHSRGYTNKSGQTYGQGHNQDTSPFANATWEDWERWYRQRDDSAKQAYAGTYVNPNAFASLVILLAVLTGVLQATRVGQYSASLGEKVQAFTEETNQFLSTRAQHLSDNNLNADGRVKHFLEKRDPTKYGLKDEEEEMYRKHFAGREHLLPTKQDSENRGA